MKKLLFTLFILLMLQQNLYSKTIKVPQEIATIQAAIDSSTHGDTLLVSPGRYIENINFNGKNIILGSLFLTSGDTSYISQTIIDGNQLGCVVVFESGEDSTATLTGFTITNGLSDTDSLRGGGITCINSSSPRLQNLVVENNEIIGMEEDFGGGGIYCLRQSSPKISNVVIRENKARYCYGAGIYCKDSSNISLVNVVISDNEYTFRGGGIAIVNSSITMRESQIVNNIARYGGGVFLENSTIKIDSTKINNNVARSNGRGGGIWASASNITMKNSDINYNSAIYNYSSQASFMSEGGGLYLRDCTVLIENSNISYNISEWNGGGLLIKNGTVKIYETSINNNSATNPYRGSGGGMCIVALEPPMPIYLENVVISDNYASSSGGGISYWANERTVPFKNVIIKNNSAGESGGGLSTNSNLIITESSECSIFLNKSKEKGSDIYLSLFDSYSTYEIHLDTVTVSEPEDYHIYPIQNINLQYNFAIFQSVNSDLYVSPTGSDLNSGVSKEDPLKSIKFALLVASADSVNHRTIHLAPGTYSPNTNGEEFPLYGRSYITLTGENVNSTILDGEGKSRIIEFSDMKNSSIENMTVQNGFAFISKNIFEEFIGSGGGIFASGYDNEILFKNLVIKNNRAKSGGGGLFLTGNVELNRVQIYNNVLDTSFGNGGGGLSMFAGTGKIINSTITNNVVYADSTISGGLSIGNAMDASIINSIIINNSPRNISLPVRSRYPYPMPKLESKLSIAYSNLQGGEEGIYNVDTMEVNWLEGNIDKDPLFVGGNPFDYNLTDSSPCINAGTSFLVWEGDTLINLSPSEYIGEAPDMGALESDVLISVEGEETLPTEFKLEQNYPNPFNPSTTIKYSIPNVGNENLRSVQLKIYDVLGREVTTLVNKEQKPGNYEIKFEAKNLSSGIYYYRITVGSFVKTMKMILIK